MKVTHHHLKLRSVFSTVKIGHQIHRPKKGAGSYSRKNQRISND
jgi:stalled ribosome alternative rescue factor ArfA